MDYLSIQQAREADGLRIVCTAGAPNPWCLSARYLFEYKKLPHLIAAQKVGSDNQELIDWSGQNSAPLVAYNDERLLVNSDSIILLAERLAPTPSVIPADPVLRTQMFGLIRELSGEQGFAWSRRLSVLHLASQHNPSDYMQQLCFKYGYSEALAQGAEARACEIVKLFCDQLKNQQQQGSAFLIGDSLTALDIYAAVFFSIMLNPLGDQDIPMPPGIRAGWEMPVAALDAASDDILFEHRQMMFDHHLKLPMKL